MFRIIDEGDVFATKVTCATSGPRTAVLDDGSVVCTFMINSCGGANDFVPMIAFSKDAKEWTPAEKVWPALEGKDSLFGSVRRGKDGKFSISGQGFDIAYPGEAFWSDEAMGMKENYVFYSISEDGKTFPEPKKVALPDVDIDTFTKLVWENLNADNKVSLFTRYIDIETGKWESRIVNKNK